MSTGVGDMNEFCVPTRPRYAADSNFPMEANFARLADFLRLLAYHIPKKLIKSSS